MSSDISIQIERILDEQSFYPGEERKSREQRQRELFDWYERYAEVNGCYNLYGMDLSNSLPDDEWLDRGIFRKQRHDVNSAYYPLGSSFPYDYTLFMRDKYAFEMLMRSIFGNEEKYVRSFALFEGGKLFRLMSDGRREEIDVGLLSAHFEGKKIVIKNTFGYGGSSVIIKEVDKGLIEYEGKKKSFVQLLAELDRIDTAWIFQDHIDQALFMKQFNESSVNTIRILTFNTGKDIETHTAVLRSGKPGSVVDNADMGGLLTGIDNEGRTGEDMFDPTEKKRIACPWAGNTVPFYEEALQLVKEAHSRIPQLFTIGWDIVITPSGPLILEGNDGWDPRVSQPPRGNALRKVWDRLLEERKRNMR